MSKVGGVREEDERIKCVRACDKSSVIFLNA